MSRQASTLPPEVPGGVLRHARSGRLAPLRARHLIGRSDGCDLRLMAQLVSGEHALLRWAGPGWELRDLGSRNGTFVGGARAVPGVWMPLEEGTPLVFGAPDESWTLAGAGPPVLFAAALDGADVVFAEAGLLSLPDPDEPQVSIYAERQGGWLAERRGGHAPIADGAIVETTGRRWRVSIPSQVAATAEAVAGQMELERLYLELRVSRDEEHVELRAFHGDARFDLGARAHGPALLMLARARLGDVAAGLPETSQGWLYVDDLLRGLKLDEDQLNVLLHRARRQVAKLGVEGAAALIERRPLTRQLRLGIAGVEVVSI